MKTRQPLHMLFAAATMLLAATACMQDDLRLPEGKYPVMIQATGVQTVATPASTRATVDGDWQDVQTVALSIGGTVKEYNVTASDADGYKSATLSRDTEPFYWTSRNPITVSAWWPYAATMPDVVVAADQSTLAGFTGSDFISAEAQPVQFDNPTLTFSHRTARVTVNLQPGTGITSVADAVVSVIGLSTEGGNPASISTYNVTDSNTYDALTAPQTVKANTQFIQVALGEGTYCFTPQSDVILAAGSRYTYTVSVTANGLELAGCTIGEWTDGGSENGTAEIGTSLPDGKYPLLLSAEIGKVQTRTAGKEAWTDGDEIGVRIGVDGKTGRYSLNADGTVKEAVTPVYWQSTVPTYVKAWYPFEAKTNVDISDQSEGFAAFDFLAATAENQHYTGSTNLTFLHQMAKVCYTLVPDGGITGNELAAATVQISGYTKVSFKEGELTVEDEGDGWITPTSDREALLVPQDMTDRPFIKVSISGNDFIYTPGAGAADLKSGTRYTYTITVKADGIDVTVEVTGSNEWTAGSEETVTGKTVLVRYTANDVKKGDYLYTDGTTSDGGLRIIYIDGSMKSLGGEDKPQPVTGKTVAGIVFWTPSETSTFGRITPANLTDDKIMAAAYPNCTHGLAVSLKDVSSSMAWQSSSESVADLQQTYYLVLPNRDNFVSVAPGLGNTDNINKILGYQNTQVLLAYNTYCGGNSKPNYIVNPVAALAEFGQNTNPAPTGSTGWFFPSLKELHILFYNDVDNVFWSRGIQTRDIVNASLSAIGGDNLDDWDLYWSSSEYVSDSKNAFCVDSYDGNVRDMSKNGQYRVRAVCVF